MKFSIEELERDGFILFGGKHYFTSEHVEVLFEEIKRYEKALEEITRQYEDTSVNRAKEIALVALGELSEERRRKIQSY